MPLCMRICWFILLVTHETPWLERAFIVRTSILYGEEGAVMSMAFLRPAGQPFTHGIFVSDARCSGAAGIEDCAGQEGSCTVFGSRDE